MIIPLNEPIECERLCKVIQKIIAKYNDENGRHAQALSINVVEISDSTAHIPKLEHKENVQNISNNNVLPEK
jgi:hypothetical protein